jgi:hypothetical protein
MSACGTLQSTNTLERLKKAARRIAANIAKPPELLSRHRTWGVRWFKK